MQVKCSTKFLITNMLNDRIGIQNILTKIKKIRNKKKNITTDMEKKEFRKYYVNFMPIYFLNLQKIDYFPAKYKLPKLSQETVGNMTRPIKYC